MTGFFKVRNLERFQHYGNRRPIWIKLYASTLQDYEFSKLNDAQRYQLMMIWVLASQMNNRVPMDERWIQEQIHSTSIVNLEPLVSGKFIEVIEDASNVLASCYQDASLDKIRVDKIGVPKKEPLGHKSQTSNTEKSPTSATSDPCPYSEIIDYLNKRADRAGRSSFKPSSRAHRTIIGARWKEGYRLDDFKAVIDNKAAEWGNDARMAKYLRPSTLFRAGHFEDYRAGNVEAEPYCGHPDGYDEE